jgi:hypothetical protein
MKERLLRTFLADLLDFLKYALKDVIISYSHRDKKWLKPLQDHLPRWRADGDEIEQYRSPN